MVFIPGLVSISFRPLSTDNLIAQMKANGLKAVEWGSDVHVPFGNLEAAEKVKKATEEAGILMPEYGSYYEIGVSDKNDIDGIVASARVLGAKVIRLWASNKCRYEMTDEYYAFCVEDAKRICAKYPDMMFCLENHVHSITDEYREALKFLVDVGMPNFRMFWQPNQNRSYEDNCAALKALLPFVYSVHVFSWETVNGKLERYPLAHFRDRWLGYLDILKDSDKENIFLMLEFMHDDKIETLPETAAELLSWLK